MYSLYHSSTLNCLLMSGVIWKCVINNIVRQIALSAHSFSIRIFSIQPLPSPIPTLQLPLSVVLCASQIFLLFFEIWNEYNFLEFLKWIVKHIWLFWFSFTGSLFFTFFFVVVETCTQRSFIYKYNKYIEYSFSLFLISLLNIFNYFSIAIISSNLFFKFLHCFSSRVYFHGLHSHCRCLFHFTFYLIHSLITINCIALLIELLVGACCKLGPLYGSFQ